MTSKPPPAADPPWGDPLPRRSESWEVSGALAAALGISSVTRVGITDLRGGDRAVTVERDTEGSLSGGASLGIGVDGAAGIDLGANAEVELSITSRETWSLPDGDAGGLLAAIGLTEVVDGPGGLPGPFGLLPVGFPLTAMADLAVSALAPDTGGSATPRPAIVDQLVGVGAAASVGISMGQPIGSIGADIEHRVGLRERSGTPGLLLESEGSYRTRAGNGGETVSGRWSIEVPPAQGPTQPVVLTETVGRDGGESVIRKVAGLDRSEVATIVDSATSLLRQGRTDEAAEAIGTLWSAVDTDLLWQDATWGEVNSDVYSVDVGAALGAQTGGSIGGGRRIVEYGAP